MAYMTMGKGESSLVSSLMQPMQSVGAAQLVQSLVEGVADMQLPLSTICQCQSCCVLLLHFCYWQKSY